MPSPCVSQRCGLCCFKLQKNDKIVASKPINALLLTNLSVYLLTSIVSKDGQKSGEMYNDFLMTDELDASYEQCHEACTHQDGQRTGCHTTCVNSIPSPPASLGLLFKVLLYQYEPSPVEMARRLEWLRLQSSSSPLWQKTKPILPRELRIEIARYLPHRGTALQYALSYSQTLKEDKDHTGSCIDTSQDIWAHSIDFEGLQYISSLSNSRDIYHTHRIDKPNPTQAINFVYIAENYLGIMHLCFYTSIQTPSIEKRCNLWWRVIHYMAVKLEYLLPKLI